MTQVHYSFPSIEQLRTIIKYVSDRCTRLGYGTPRPSLTFHGSVKLHGTNASVVVTADDFYTQSRSNVITPLADNAGFAAFAHSTENKAALMALAQAARTQYFGTRDYVEEFPVKVALYGEWCGASIQKGVALNKLPKMFVLFAARLISVADEERSIWLMPWDVEAAYDAVSDLPAELKCIEKFKTWSVSINMREPQEAQNELVRITAEVEAQCPVAFALGADGIGEGVVWTCVGSDSPLQIRIDDLVFKVKGEKHSDTKVTTTAPIDVERMASIKVLAEAVCTDHRLEKAVAFLQETLHVEDVFDMVNISGFLKWVGGDVVKEELDTITENGFAVKEVTKAANELAKAWFLKRVNASAGLLNE